MTFVYLFQYTFYNLFSIPTLYCEWPCHKCCPWCYNVLAALVAQSRSKKQDTAPRGEVGPRGVRTFGPRLLIRGAMSPWSTDKPLRMRPGGVAGWFA